ncbi:C2H2 type zinc-finger-domain-containing protein [Gongronella butleri]|nr:C2H2 type zinc-finger-domain-containing protein [Gongronella butleri]
MSDSYQPSSGLYTCISCKVAFETGDAQRLHYRSDWHRYNLKRKVADLPPVTKEQFEQKDQAQQAEKEKEKEKETPQPFNGYCQACRKSFSSENQYDNHIRSKKHKENQAKFVPREAKKPAAAASESPEASQTSSSSSPAAATPATHGNGVIDMTFTDEMTEEEINAKIDAKIKAAPRLNENDCLFCSHVADSFDDNMLHMTKEHSFFIPDIEFLVDIHGLIRYLGEKITVGNVCLYCNGRGRSFLSMAAVRKHMTDKGHCMIAWEDDDDALELVDFYDYSSSYPQVEGEEVDVDAELSVEASGMRLADDEMSLVLPSGAVVGHRQLKRYYDQRLKPEDTRDSVLINKLIGHYTSDHVFESMRKQTSHRHLITDGSHGAKPKEAFKDKRVHEDYKTRVGIQSNKLQKYFRIQII